MHFPGDGRSGFTVAMSGSHVGRLPLIAASAALLVVLAGWASPAHASLITLADNNSSVDFDTQTQAGAYNWNIDGQDVLKKQWFWFRVGNVAPEQSIDAIPQTFVLAS